MKNLLILLSGLVLAATAGAQELGRVISSTAVIQQVSVPRQVCTTDQVTVQPSKSGAGAIMGAIAGGAVGNAVGDGSGRTIATILGFVGGAMLGDRIEGAPAAQTQNVQRCSTQTFYENRTVGYNVIYEYAGRQYTVQLPNDPGPTIRLQVTPVEGASKITGSLSSYNSVTSVVEAPIVVVQRAPTIVTPIYRYGYSVPPRVNIYLDDDEHGHGRRRHNHWN
jgi:uncharacterized protein YcfJ